MYLQKRAAFAAVVLCLTLLGCGNGQEPGGLQTQQSPGSDDSSTPDASVIATSPNTKKTTRTRKPPVLVEWIKEFTPTGGGGTHEESAYTWFMKGDCETTLSVARDKDSEMGEMEQTYRTLYEGAAAACLAAFDQRREMWPVALGRHPNVDTSMMSCWHRSVYRIFTAMVEAYRNDPEVQFSRTAGGGRVECPQLSGLSPDHGARSGGYRVEIEGANLPASMELGFVTGDDIVVSASMTGGRLSFTMPPYGGSETTVTLKIVDAPRIEGVYASFTFDG